MKRFWRSAVTVVLVAGFFIGAWLYVNRHRLERQWASYEVGAAKGYEQARERIGRLEQRPDAEARLGELVGKWGTGNRQFDEYLARYVTDPASSESLRAAFSQELGRRPALLARWAHFWAWHTSLEPGEQIASIVDYFGTRAYAAGNGTQRPITWREALDLQAVFTLCGARDRAARLRPGNWREHFRVWQETAPDELPEVQRPEQPLP